MASRIGSSLRCDSSSSGVRTLGVWPPARTIALRIAQRQQPLDQGLSAEEQHRRGEHDHPERPVRRRLASSNIGAETYHHAHLGRDKRALLAQSRRPHAAPHRPVPQDLRRSGDVRVGGLALIAAIIFAETGLLVGFFLPGDSLLVTAGHLLHQRQPGEAPLLNIVWLNLVVDRGGDRRRHGRLLDRRQGRARRSSRREQSLFFSRSTCCARRSSTRRTAARRSSSPASCRSSAPSRPVVAGVGKMSYRRFVSFNVFGGIGWVAQHDAARVHARADLPPDHQADRQGHHRHHLRLADPGGHQLPRSTERRRLRPSVAALDRRQDGEDAKPDEKRPRASSRRSRSPRRPRRPRTPSSPPACPRPSASASRCCAPISKSRARPRTSTTTDPAPAGRTAT